MNIIKLTEKDYILVNQLDFLKNPIYQKVRTIYKWRWLLILISMLCFTLLFLPILNRYEVVCICLLGIIWLFLGLNALLIHFRVTGRAKNLWKNRILDIYNEVTWDNNHLFFRSDYHEIKIKWNTYFNIIQDENFILLYIQPYGYSIIPKRFFEDNEELQAFLKNIEKKTNQ